MFKRRGLVQSMAMLGGGSALLWLGAAPRSAEGAQGPPPPGPQPVAGLTAAEFQAFRHGVDVFAQREAPPTGLGPVFNGVACGECHRAAGLGGASVDNRVSVVTRIGAMVGGKYSDLTNVGGPLLQARSLREQINGYPVAGEVVPSSAQFVSRRITTPVFGDGLIEAIPDSTLVALEQTRRADGVKGVANRVMNPETGKVEIGRFGWKAQVSAIHWFASDAYVNEMGITNPSFPKENLPQGRAIPPGADRVPDPEEGGSDVRAVADFMRFAAPLEAAPSTGNSIRGEAVFEKIKCNSCHVTSLQTGVSTSKALSNVTIRIYSDLLLHHMGSGLADGIQQGQATGDQFRTSPLWGLGRRPFLLHDGRSRTADDAVRQHGGEAAASVTRYNKLSAKDRAALLEFLSGL